jgi:hypothetical protein
VVQDRQEKRAMRAHALGARVVELPHTDLFSTDPTMTIRENLSQPIFISIVETPSAELIEQFEADRAWIHQEWEALRTTLVGDRVSYAQQLGGELEGETRVIFDLAQSYLEKLESGEEPSSKEFFRYIRVVRMISEWDGLTNGALDVRGLKRFLRSAHYAGLPSVFVSAALTAALLTGNRPIQSGDAKDIEHISMMLPYADLMIVDRFMKHLIKTHGLHAKYGTAVCHLGDEEELSHFFDCARAVTPHL